MAGSPRRDSIIPESWLFVVVAQGAIGLCCNRIHAIRWHRPQAASAKTWKRATIWTSWVQACTHSARTARIRVKARPAGDGAGSRSMVKSVMHVQSAELCEGGPALAGDRLQKCLTHPCPTATTPALKDGD